ncbi:hypothetical protein [Psychrobacillus sp. FJAT-21963]|uniref:hypothetical protein n=1 Tax=Psychrobacillus sp. FJAT-21963 TaxID=1712028 RepID=UPI0006F87011|nr:hypothetical protein [Psychrobacillus sp. FJAT-21963]KQL37137.1 hypothetical protein AN959_03605 [Psychrobacillus sp. FJAT-21963]
MNDFYFAYNYDENSQSASRLYRFINGEFDRYDEVENKWKPDSEQCKIFIGEDWEYDEISEKQAKEIIENMLD